MQRSDVLTGLREILVPFIGVDKEKLNTVTETTDLAKDLGVKSTDVINIVLEIEKKWGIAFEDEEIDSLQELSMKSIIDLVLKKNP
jgi:acyl carrier protein